MAGVGFLRLRGFGFPYPKLTTSFGVARCVPHWLTHYQGTGSRRLTNLTSFDLHMRPVGSTISAISLSRSLSTAMSNSELDQTADRPFHHDPLDGPVSVPPALSNVDQLFHDPALPPSAICPQRFPGIDPASTDALIRTLAHNHVAWHIFFNFKGFHKFVPDSHWCF